MAKKAYVYSGTDWVPLASEVTDLTPYQTIANSQAPFRNLIINGAMQVAQRGTSTASLSSVNEYYTTDRWKFRTNSMGTWTMSQESDGPTGSGFVKSTKVLCTTADASPAAGDFTKVRQIFEGQNLQSIRKGTSDAQQLTLSFWVKSNVTGTYIAELYDADNTRQVSKSYTIDTSGTWEKKTITFPADTTGAFDNDNGNSMSLELWLGAGSTYTSGTLNTSWASSTDANVAVGQTNLASATNNYWQITGVQLEVGTVATPFEFTPIDIEINRCRRYYETSWWPNATQVNSDVSHVSNTAGYITVRPRVSKRVNITNSNTFVYNSTTLNQLRNTNTNATLNIGWNGNAIAANPNTVALYDLSAFTANTAFDYNWIIDVEL